MDQFEIKNQLIEMLHRTLYLWHSPRKFFGNFLNLFPLHSQRFKNKTTLLLSFYCITFSVTLNKDEEKELSLFKVEQNTSEEFLSTQSKNRVLKNRIEVEARMKE